MTVQQLIDILSKCDPEWLVALHMPSQGMEAVLCVEHIQDNLSTDYSWIKRNIITLHNGNGKYMLGNGHDVIGYIEQDFDSKLAIILESITPITSSNE